MAESTKRLIIEQRLRVKNRRREFGRVVVASGFLAVWFIFRGTWYDVGKFYDRKGQFTGYYCDIIRPVTRLLSNPSSTAIITDLFLDLWISKGGRYVVLDEDDLQRAVAKRAISTSLALRARKELAALIRSTELGYFPPRSIREFQPTMNGSRLEKVG